MYIKSYITKDTATLNLDNIPEGVPYQVKQFNTNEAAYKFVRELRKAINSRKLLTNLGLY